MKRLCLFAAIIALAMVSCSNSSDDEQSRVVEYTKCDIKPVELSTISDSINYSLGLVNGTQIKKMYLAKDSSDGAVAEFINALQRGYYDEIEKLSEVAESGRNFGRVVKLFERQGLFTMASLQLNEKIVFQGLINGLLADTTMGIAPDQANMYLDSIYHILAQANETEQQVSKPVLAKCGKKAHKVQLKSQNDSINYMFGLISGSQNFAYIYSADNADERLEEFISAVNDALKKDVYNLQLIDMGERVGSAIREQETKGLLGIPHLATNFSLLMQGFIDGLYLSEATMTADAASAYLETAIEQLQGAEGRKFLEQNAKKEGVVTTESGLQYEVLKMGDGPKPSATDRVKVHYHGTLIDGTVFDSSVDRGEPITFDLNQVIKGWTEGVQLMPVGSKFRFYIPQELAYGGRATGSIPAYSALIFEVELLAIEK